MSKFKEKSIKNQSKIDLNLGRHLDSDFSSIFFGFGSQVGFQNPIKIDLKRHQKMDSKKDTSWTLLGAVLSLTKAQDRSAATPGGGLTRGSWLSLKLCYGISLDLRRTVGSEGSIY